MQKANFKFNFLKHIYGDVHCHHHIKVILKLGFNNQRKSKYKNTKFQLPELFEYKTFNEQQEDI